MLPFVRFGINRIEVKLLIKNRDESFMLNSF